MTANAAECRIFSHDKKFAPLTEVKSLEWPGGRLASRDVNADRPGRSFDSGGQGRHAMEPRGDVHEEEGVRFTREIAHQLAESQRSGAFGQLVIIAAPRLLGQLRDALPDPVQRCVTHEIAKDLTAYDAQQLTDWLRKEFWERS